MYSVKFFDITVQMYIWGKEYQQIFLSDQKTKLFLHLLHLQEHDHCYDDGIAAGCDWLDEYVWAYDWSIDENKEVSRLWLAE